MKENQLQNIPLNEGEMAYEKPTIEVIEMEMEGVLCASGTGDDFEPGW